RHDVPALGPACGRHRPLPRRARHRRRGGGLILPAAVDALLEHRLPDDRVDPWHPDRLPDHGRAAREGAARLAPERARALEPEDARRLLARSQTYPFGGSSRFSVAFPTSSVILVGIVVMTERGSGAG